MYSKKKCVCVYTCVCVLLRVSGAVQLLLFCASIDDRLEVSHRNTRNLDWWEHRENTVLHFYFLQMKLVKH